MLVIEALAAADLSHVFKLSRPLLFELVVTPANGQVVMSHSESVIVSALDFFDSFTLEYLLHVHLV